MAKRRSTKRSNKRTKKSMRGGSALGDWFSSWFPKPKQPEAMTSIDAYKTIETQPPVQPNQQSLVQQPLDANPNPANPASNPTQNPTNGGKYRRTRRYTHK